MMRELLNISDKSESKMPIEIPENKYGKNEFIKTILLQSSDGPNSRISVELSPDNDIRANILDKIKPSFIAITCLGNGHLELPIQDIPAVVLARKFSEQHFSVLLHLACRNIGKERMFQILTHCKDAGIRNIFALQGDWSYVLEHDDNKCDFPHASDLVTFIKDNFGDRFCVGVAGYPNIHPHSQNLDEDLKFLKLKVSKGADFMITQAAFDYNTLAKFAITCKENDINVPILAGILVIKSYKALINLEKCCEFKVPREVLEFVEKNQDNDELIKTYGLDLAANILRKCLDNNELFAGAHIFSMNDLDDVRNVILRL